MAYKARSALAAVGRMLSTVSSFSVSLGIDSFSLGVERDPVRASTGNLDLDFQDVVADVSRVLGEERVAFAILVDEMQDLDGELLAALITTQHEASQRNWNFYVIGAGLPSLPGRLATAKSYAERMFLVRQIGRLSDAESRRVLVEPAERMGARFEEEALTHLVRISGRYPYFLQEFGSAIWRTSPRSPFTGADARRAEAVGLAQLDAMGLSHREPWCDVPGLFRREGLSDPVSVSWISAASGEPSLLGEPPRPGCRRRGLRRPPSRPGGVDSVMSPQVALRQVGSRGSSAGGSCRAEPARREAGWIPLRRARITQAGLGPRRSGRLFSGR